MVDATASKSHEELTAGAQTGMGMVKLLMDFSNTSDLDTAQCSCPTAIHYSNVLGSWPCTCS